MQITGVGVEGDAALPRSALTDSVAEISPSEAPG